MDKSFANSLPAAKIVVWVSELEADPRKPDSGVYVYRVSIGPSVRDLKSAADMIGAGTDDGKMANPLSQIMTAASVKWWLTTLTGVIVEVEPVECRSGESLKLSGSAIMARLADRLGMGSVPANWVFA